MKSRQADISLALILSSATHAAGTSGGSGIFLADIQCTKKTPSATACRTTVRIAAVNRQKYARNDRSQHLQRHSSKSQNSSKNYANLLHTSRVSDPSQNPIRIAFAKDP